MSTEHGQGTAPSSSPLGKALAVLASGFFTVLGGVLGGTHVTIVVPPPEVAKKDALPPAEASDAAKSEHRALPGPLQPKPQASAPAPATANTRKGPAAIDVKPPKVTALPRMPKAEKTTSVELVESLGLWVYSAEGWGVVVVRAEPGSPSSRLTVTAPEGAYAGVFAKGDTITHADGIAIRGVTDLREVVAGNKTGVLAISGRDAGARWRAAYRASIRLPIAPTIARTAP